MDTSIFVIFKNTLSTLEKLMAVIGFFITLLSYLKGKENKASWSKRIYIVIFIICGIIAVGHIFFFVRPIVPDVKGKTYLDATRMLDEFGFTYKRIENSEFVRITDSYPSAGKIAKQGDYIDFDYNVENDEDVYVFIPNVIGMDYASARDRLISEGLNCESINKEYGNSDPMTAEITGQDPEASNEPVVKGTKVELYYSLSEINNRENESEIKDNSSDKSDVISDKTENITADEKEPVDKAEVDSEFPTENAKHESDEKNVDMTAKTILELFNNNTWQDAVTALSSMNWTELKEKCKNNRGTYIYTETEKSLGVYYYKGDYCLYIGNYIGNARNGNALWIILRNVGMSGIYECAWSNDIPSGTCNFYYLYEDKHYELKNTGTVLNGLWNGDVTGYISGMSYTEHYDNGIVRTYGDQPGEYGYLTAQGGGVTTWKSDVSGTYGVWGFADMW